MSAPRAPRRDRTARLLAPLLCLAVLGPAAGACGRDDAPPAAPAAPTSAELSAEQRAAVERFVGTWSYAGGEAEQEAANEAVRTVTGQMNGLIQGMAEERLLPAAKLDATITFAEKDGIVTITRSEQPQPFQAPADGRTFEMKTAEDEDAKGTLTVVDGALVTTVETEDGGGGRTYRIDDAGALQVEARTFSPRLPADVEYTAHYTRR